jgi:hypothetical protein
MEIYVHSAGREDPEIVEVAEATVVREIVSGSNSGDAAEFVWVEETEEPVDLALTLEQAGIKHRDHVHRGRCRRVDVKVRFNADTKAHDFTPAARMERVLKWATGKSGFDLTPAEAAKHTLAVPGADHPLDPRVHVGSLVTAPSCEVTLDLLPKARFEG